MALLYGFYQFRIKPFELLKTLLLGLYLLDDYLKFLHQEQRPCIQIRNKFVFYNRFFYKNHQIFRFVDVFSSLEFKNKDLGD
jgi:hypothetical protein